MHVIIMKDMYTIKLKEGKEKQALFHHPWVFSGAIKSIDPPYTEAGLASVCSSSGAFVAYGYYDEKSHIILHLLSWQKDIIPDDEFVYRKAVEAVERRKAFFSDSSSTNAFRLIHGEADFIPGVAADWYNGYIKIIYSSRFAYSKLPVIARALAQALKAKLIAANADREYAASEALDMKTRYFIDGSEAKIKEDELEDVRINENGIIYSVSLRQGQKSGFYCDQRDNRMIAELYAKNRRVLDVCSYTGSFTLHALRAGAASVKAIDSSESVLRHLLYQVNINEDEKTIAEGSREKVEILSADCFEALRKEKDDYYDLIILDPPKLAKTKGALEKAERAYKDINRVAMNKIRNNGILISFSCSASLTREELRKVLSWASKDAHVEIQILRNLFQAEDHPVRLSFPESEYLKGFVMKVIKAQSSLSS